jgi:CheY-like chemotaxis protein
MRSLVAAMTLAASHLLPFYHMALEPQTLQATILVADDDADVLMLVCAVLTEAQFGYLTARNGKEAVTAFQQASCHIDLFLSDFNMPEMNGLEAARSIRLSDPTIPVLIMSSNSGLTSPDGEWQFLEKPFTAIALLNRINDLLCVDAPQ